MSKSAKDSPFYTDDGQKWATGSGVDHWPVVIMVLLHWIEGMMEINPSTPLKFNMEPENGGLEDDFPFQMGAF